MMKISVLLLGGGGREHALAWKIAQSPKLRQLYIAPGNPGTAQIGANVDINPENFDTLKEFCLEKNIDMIVVGPEAPLVKGITDFFNADEKTKHIAVIGASKAGAQLEGSKDFAKQFMQKYNIPTAKYKTITNKNIDEGFDFIAKLSAPYVLKADGLAAGKGVVILQNADEAKQMLQQMLNGKFGAASSKVVVEEFLQGIEVSMFALTDGISYKILPEAKDYKRIGNGDTGANTGGMGAVSPVKFVDEEFTKKVCTQIIEPTISGLQKEKINYKGFIFFGLMNVGGNPYVIEYNARMGDPETQVVMPRLDADLLDLFDGVASQILKNKKCAVSANAAVTVVCASGGYPENYKKGMEITGLEKAKNSVVFQAGTSLCGNILQTSGGRVLSVTSLADTIENAREQSYKSIASIKFNGMYFRNDIGLDVINYK